MIGTLAACGGGGEDGVVRTVPQLVEDGEVDGLSVGATADLFTDIEGEESLTIEQVNAWDNAIDPIATALFDEQLVTPWAVVPATGTAEVFVGGIELNEQGIDNRIFGTLRAETNFTNGVISGTANNFVHTQSDTALTGELALTAQFFRGIDLTENFGMSGSLTGNLTGTGISGIVDVDIAGDFADGGDVIYGVGLGTAGDADVRAAFVASQD